MPVKLSGEAVIAVEAKSGTQKIATESVSIELNEETGEVEEVAVAAPPGESTLAQVAGKPTTAASVHAAAPKDGELGTSTAPDSSAASMALVTYGLGFTKKTGDYENVRPFVQLTMPAPPTSMGIEAVWGFVHEWVDTKASEIHAGVDAQLKS